MTRISKKDSTDFWVFSEISPILDNPSIYLVLIKNDNVFEYCLINSFRYCVIPDLIRNPVFSNWTPARVYPILDTGGG
jgi:hypothetical protein